MSGQCKTQDCDRKTVARGLCSRCYKRWQNSEGAGDRCSIDGCDRPAVSKGWCRTHYARWTRHGTTADPTSLSEAERFWLKVDKAGPIPAARPRLGPCWLWTGAINPNGYGAFDGSVERYVHRWAYADAVGPIPAGLEVDHLCRVRHCVRATHLEAVTTKVNTLRSEAPSAKGARKTECDAGHPFDLLNTYIDRRGRRHCRACQRDRDAVRRTTEHHRELNRAHQRAYQQRKRDARKTQT